MILLEILKNLNEILDKIQPLLKKISKLTRQYGCFIVMIVILFILCFICKEITKFGNLLLIKEDRFKTKQIVSIENKFYKMIKQSYHICGYDRSLSINLMRRGYIETTEPSMGKLNCEINSLMSHISYEYPKMLSDINVLNIVIQEKSITPLRFVQNDILENENTNLEHKNILIMRYNLLKEIFKNDKLKYRILSFYTNIKHSGLDNVKRIESEYPDKLSLIEVDSLDFDSNLRRGVYFFIKYKEHVIIFYQVGGFQYDTVKIQNTIRSFGYNIYSMKNFYKTNYFKFIKSKKIQF